MVTKSYLTALALILGAGAVALPVLAQNANGGGNANDQMMQGMGQGMGPGDGPGMGQGMDMGMDGMRGPKFDFAGADANGDGKVTKEELMAYRQTMISGVDADGDGMISVEELAAHMKARMDAQIDAHAKARVAAQDLNGDGKLSAGELLAPPMPTRMFDRLDANGDGAISQDEIAQARAQMMDRMGGGRDDGRGMRDGHGMHHDHDRGRGQDGKGDRGWFGWGDN